MAGKRMPEYLIESGIIAGYLISESTMTKALETAMMEGICFTTALDAAELYYMAKTEKQKKAVDSVFRALKVLGINSRFVLGIERFSQKTDNWKDALFCEIARINKLIILSTRKNYFAECGLDVVSPGDLGG